MENEREKPEVGKVLLSEPFLADSNFSRSVILLAEHNDMGTLGFVLNNPIKNYLHELFQDLDSDVKIPLYKGGPVELGTLNFIHTDESLKDSATEILPGLYLGGDFDKVKLQINIGVFNPQQYKFFVGYSGWAEDQLYDELQEDSWVVSDLEVDEIMSTALVDDLWRTAMRNLGGEFAILANAPLNPQWN
jgi:putative transcriptional regulator